MFASLANESQQLSVFLSNGDVEDTKQRWFSIGDLAREFNITLRSLRFYEDKGLLDPRRDGLSRIYSRRDRTHLQRVLSCKRLGFSLREIKELLDVYDTRNLRAHHLKFVIGKFKDQMIVLQQQKENIENGISELADHIEQISEVLDEFGSKRA